MEFVIEKRDFLRGLGRTHGVADRKHAMPILSNILLSTESSDAIRMNATDLYIGVSTKVPGEVKSGGQVTVAARTLFDIIKALPNGQVHWELKDGHVQLRSGKTRYRLPTMPGEDFPPLPNPADAEFAKISAEHILELISLTSYSMSTDDSRPHLAAALFQGEGDVLRMVTTDTHRLSKAERKVGSAVNFDMLLPHKGIAELRKFLDSVRADHKFEDGGCDIEIAVSGANAFFQAANASLTIRLVDEQFPPYQKVIPSAHTRRVMAARNTMVEALKRISLVSSANNSGVQLHIADGIARIQSQNPEIGEGVEEVEVDYSGDELSIGFNAKYLLDVLGALPHDEVAFELSGELDPGAIRPTGDGLDFVGVIMPMRI